MPPRSQRQACSLHRLVRESANWKPFPPCQRAQVKRLLHTDLGRVLTAFQEAGLTCLMEWEYYAQICKRDPAAAYQVKLEAQLRGIPERWAEA